MDSVFEGLPWFGVVDTKKDAEGNDEEYFRPLLPPMAMFPPGKRPAPEDIVTPPGDMAVWDPKNKQWFLIQGTSDLTAIVMSAIERTPDPTAEPDDCMYGKIRVAGKDYGDPPDDENADPNERFDDCCCLALGKDPDGDNHQQLYKGQQIKVKGPYKRKNPDYVDPESLGENEEPPEENPEYIEYYEAEPIREYSARLDADVKHEEGIKPQNGTITLKDSDDNEIVMFVSGARIPSGQEIKGGETASYYDIELRETDDGINQLFIMYGACPRDIEEAEETEEE